MAGAPICSTQRVMHTGAFEQTMNNPISIQYFYRPMEGTSSAASRLEPFALLLLQIDGCVTLCIYDATCVGSDDELVRRTEQNLILLREERD